jgi:uncharacterized protein (TIGR00290 family)
MTDECTSQPILLAWSGGKDCLMALDRLADDPRWRVVGLMSTMIRDEDRVVMHRIRGEIVREQARLLGLPLVEVAIDAGADNIAYEAAHAAALAHTRACWPGIRHVAFGDLFLADVRAWREAQLARANWAGMFPLWGESTGKLSAQFLQRGHRAVVCCVDTQQADAMFCGREFDRAMLDALPATVDPCGENGEFHTLAHASPLFAQALDLDQGASYLRDGRFAYTDFTLRERTPAC